MANVPLSIKYFSPRGPISEGGDATKEMVGAIDLGTYATGGLDLDLSEWFNSVEFLAVEPFSGYVFQYDYTNKKVLAYYADYDAEADGALIEYPDQTGLTLSGVRFFAKGF
jgi:hypothetical protein